MHAVLYLCCSFLKPHLVFSEQPLKGTGFLGCVFRGLAVCFQKKPIMGIFRGTVFQGYGFLGAVLGVQFLRLLGGQKPQPKKPYPQEPYLCKTFDRFTGPNYISDVNVILVHSYTATLVPIYSIPTAFLQPFLHPLHVIFIVTLIINKNNVYSFIPFKFLLN